MTKFEEKPIATVKMIPTSDGNEIKFKTSSALGSYLISKGEADLYLKSQLQQQALTKTVEDFQGELEDLIDDILDDYISDLPFDGKKYKFIEKYAPQALPVVPECVGKYIKDCKKEGDCLFGVFADATRVEHDMPDLVYFWLGDEGNNDELFARAWLDGYTVEKPHLFRVCLLDGRHTLTRRDPRKTLPFNYTFLWSYSSELKEMREINREVDLFTEQEIKSIDERYWQFAVPVEVGE